MFHITRKQWFYTLAVIVILAIGFGLAVWLYETKSRVELTSFTVSMLSAVVSLVALFIAMQTYLSIDSVNNVSKMDGNILDNEYYVTSVPELILSFPQTDTAIFREAMLSSIEVRINNQSRTAVNFVDSLQYIIDILVFFPAFKSSESEIKEKTSARIDKIVESLYRRLDAFQAVSKGNATQMKEAVKLINSVIAYQQRTGNAQLDLDTAILAVRGPILRNAVASTVYYNYLGLYYRRSAVALLERVQDESVKRSKVESVENLNRLSRQASLLDASGSERVKRLLTKAMQAFDTSLNSCADDPMWRGYILFNQARTAFMQQAYFSERNDALSLMREAIDARSILNELISSLLGSEMPPYQDATESKAEPRPSVLQQHYWYQQEYAEQLFVNYCTVLKASNCTYRNEPMEKLSDYEDKVRHYLNYLNPADQKMLLEMARRSGSA